MYPCDFYVLDEYCLGNLNTDSFQAIGERRKEIRFMENSVNHGEKCRACPYFFICRGGCRRQRVQPGTEEGENYFCKGYGMFFDVCLQRMKRIAWGLVGYGDVKG